MNSGGQALLERLETDRKPRRGSGREAVDARMGYVQERLPSLDYPAFGARGWHIGSRAMEASCKTLPDRMKGSGMKWDRRGAETIAALTALKQNGQWSND